MVVIDEPDKYKFLHFQKSNNKTKKYDAILQNKDTGRKRTVAFGSRKPLMEQYIDKTGLGIYSKLDHKDKKRRENFLKRHDCSNAKKFSSNYFSCKYLW